jgi:hypothetical protein
MFEHTPGPWVAVPRPQGTGFYIRSNASPFAYVCSVPEDDFADEAPDPVPNARLIAAAPDLLAAVDALIAAIESVSAADLRTLGPVTDAMQLAYSAREASTLAR